MIDDGSPRDEGMAGTGPKPAPENSACRRDALHAPRFSCFPGDLDTHDVVQPVGSLPFFASTDHAVAITVTGDTEMVIRR